MRTFVSGFGDGYIFGRGNGDGTGEGNASNFNELFFNFSTKHYHGSGTSMIPPQYTNPNLGSGLGNGIKNENNFAYCESLIQYWNLC